MKHVFLAFTIVIAFAGITITPELCSAEPYSSDVTRKWAAQREAQREKNRLQEQRNLEKKRKRDRQMQMLIQTFNIEEGQGGTDVNSVPERRRPAKNAPVDPPANSYADFGSGDYNVGCPISSDGNYHPDGRPYWGVFPGLLGTAESSSCVVCQNNKWKGLEHTYCPGS